MDLYAENILDHYRNPKHSGSLKGADFSAESSNASCGDKVKISLTVKNHLIVDARFIGSGCAISMASTDILPENIIGKRVTEIAKISQEKHFKNLGIEISYSRMKCAGLGLKALHKAIGSKTSSKKITSA